jgi:crotonobetainyl-CoA:carnitine CoA-transferase CaiB-like acyl-CoA transferase
MIQGLTAFMPVQGGAGDPAPIGSPVVDKVAAVSAALSALAALEARRTNDGIGQRVRVKMFDAFAAFMLPERMNNHTFGSPEARGLPVVDTSRVSCAIATSDGHVTGNSKASARRPVAKTSAPIRAFASFAGTDTSAWRRAPKCGEHTAEVAAVTS